MPTFEGGRDARRLRIAIVVSRFNDFVTSRLLTGAREALASAGLADDAIDVVWVPGAFEVAAAARHVALTRRPAAVVCLGCVIRGGTPHFEYVCRAATDGVREAARDTGVPVLFGVLTTDDTEQALARAGGLEGNKGQEVALAAIEMARLAPQLAHGPGGSA